MRHLCNHLGEIFHEFLLNLFCQSQGISLKSLFAEIAVYNYFYSIFILIFYHPH